MLHKINQNKQTVSELLNVTSSQFCYSVWNKTIYYKFTSTAEGYVEGYVREEYVEESIGDLMAGYSYQQRSTPKNRKITRICSTWDTFCQVKNANYYN